MDPGARRPPAEFFGGMGGWGCLPKAAQRATRLGRRQAQTY